MVVFMGSLCEDSPRPSSLSSSSFSRELSIASLLIFTLFPLRLPLLLLIPPPLPVLLDVLEEDDDMCGGGILLLLEVGVDVVVADVVVALFIIIIRILSLCKSCTCNDCLQM